MFFPSKSPFYEASPYFLDDSRPMAWRAGMADKSTITREPHFSILKQVWTIQWFRIALEAWRNSWQPASLAKQIQGWRPILLGESLPFWRGKERSFYLLTYSFFSPKHIWCAWSNPEFWERRLSFLIFGYAPLFLPLRPSLSYGANVTLDTARLKGAETAAPVESGNLT